jgi:endonuclease G
MQNNEVFIVAGPHGKGGEGANGPATTIGRTNIQVPSHTWKVVLVLPAGKTSPKDVTTKARTYAIITPNNQSVTEDWKKYEVKVADVEKLTGLKFFGEVPPEIAQSLKGSPGASPPSSVQSSPTPVAPTKKPAQSDKGKKPLKGGLSK